MSIFKRLVAFFIVSLTLVSMLSFSSLGADGSLGVFSTAGVASGVGAYKITTESLRIRSGPATSYTKLGNLTYGQTVTVTELSGSWGKISYNGISGWICLDYASKVDSTENAVAGKQHTLSETGLEMIKDFEGYSRYKYWDGGHYSIGYGTTCGADDYPNGISETEASALLLSEMSSYEAGLDAFLYTYSIQVSQAQYDALVSFTYNFGNPWTRWDEFTLKTILINGAYKYSEEQIRAAFGEFVKSGDVIIQGLVSRRNREADMFISGTEVYKTGSFNDVYTRDWYYNAVEFVNEKGYMTGITGGKFDPEAKLTRAMMVTTLGKLGGVNMTAYNNKTSFVDVSTDKWYAPYVEWAYKLGITQGTGDGSFSPDKMITRQDMVVMLYKFADVAGYKVDFTDTDILSGYKDAAKVSSYAVVSVKWALTRGCITGNGDGYILPLSKATRAQTAQMIKNFYEKGRVC